MANIIMAIYALHTFCPFRSRSLSFTLTVFVNELFFSGVTSCVCLLGHKLNENRPPWMFLMVSNGRFPSHNHIMALLSWLCDVVIEPLYRGKDEVELSSLDVIEIACVSSGRKCVSPHKLHDKRFGFKFLYLWTLNTANAAYIVLMIQAATMLSSMQL